MVKVVGLLVAALLTATLAVAETLPLEGADHFAVAGLTRSGVAALLSKLQAAVAARDVVALAAITKFPLRVNGKRGPRTRTELERDFDAIFNEKVRTSIRDQKVDDLGASSWGVWIGTGEVWLNAVCAADSPAGKCNVERIAVWSVNN